MYCRLRSSVQQTGRSNNSCIFFIYQPWSIIIVYFVESNCVLVRCYCSYCLQIHNEHLSCCESCGGHILKGLDTSLLTNSSSPHLMLPRSYSSLSLPPSIALACNQPNHILFMHSVRKLGKKASQTSQLTVWSRMSCCLSCSYKQCSWQCCCFSDGSTGSTG